MMRRTWVFVLTGLLLAVTQLLEPTPTSQAARAATTVFLNGVPYPVHFNDGDSFMVLEGPMADSRARLAGYNTLESYGPVHSWGSWHPYELYINAKQATLFARRGVWHCTSEMERDGYGRVLWHCPDLAVALIRRGFAHALTITEEAARIEFVRAQQAAIAERRGMWAHGVPYFVMTSVHSLDEYADRDVAYNRLVSTVDGHSESWQHSDTHTECARVCHEDTVVDEAKVDEVARSLREDPGVSSLLADIYNIELASYVSRFARTGELPTIVPENLVAPLTQKLTQARDAGRFGEITQQPGACVVHVLFQRRYGPNRPDCLRGHGDDH